MEWTEPCIAAWAARAASERWTAKLIAWSNEIDSAAATAGRNTAAKEAARKKIGDMETPWTNEGIAGVWTSHASTSQSTE
ncbi:hypothetical protein CTTA_3230 [Comamonas testosteroni]|jgi:hypothetical protein|uniref:Uncharacterized protein n=1 Tax=Comamonas testosteroni TaxID=285 RepID=A0A5A7MHS2_COMTE|nr:hypothetical protein Cthiooxydans_24910 [Comamonas thiooxydans]GEQ76225.1 hypothetical protein CTTA_3230 [Comamonas testosteroni]